MRTRLNGCYDQAFQTQSAGFEVLLAACVFLLAKQGEDRPDRRLWAKSIAPLTLPIYLMHGLVLLIMNRIGFDPMRFPGIIAASAGVLIFCFLAAKTLVSIRPLCFLFTGLRYDAASESCSWLFSLRRARMRQTGQDSK